MISVVIPSLDAEDVLGPTLGALVPGAIDGLVIEAILADGGSTDGTREIAEAAGMEIIRAVDESRGSRLRAGAAAAKGRWLLFLNADTHLDANWVEQAAMFIKRIERGERPEAAATFRFALDEGGLLPWLFERLVALRFLLLRLPHGEQGLLIPRSLYERLGGFQPIPFLEDVDLVRKLKRRQLKMLKVRAVTSAERYRRDGYLARSFRNLCCLLLYYFRVPPEVLLRKYG
jgi:glycosyltransferase involved in cell wall biosynthesis